MTFYVGAFIDPTKFPEPFIDLTGDDDEDMDAGVDQPRATSHQRGRDQPVTAPHVYMEDHARTAMHQHPDIHDAAQHHGQELDYGQETAAGEANTIVNGYTNETEAEICTICRQDLFDTTEAGYLVQCPQCRNSFHGCCINDMWKSTQDAPGLQDRRSFAKMKCPLCRFVLRRERREEQGITAWDRLHEAELQRLTRWVDRD